MIRGDRREEIFRDDQDRARFLETLAETCAKTGWQVHAFCLMAIGHTTSYLYGAVGNLTNVLYAGRIVEYTEVKPIFGNPMHPYTQALLHCSLLETEVKRELEPIKGGVPGPFDIPVGCAFAPRCPYAWEQCQQSPQIVTTGQSQVRCWRYV
jgi:oligopeptide/dipeptide ABC transporter ATP-binding protein